MIYIIDGSNLYHYWRMNEIFTFFKRVLHVFSGEKKGNKIYLFFDGRPLPLYPERFQHEGMEIIFTPGVQADERIKDMILSLKGSKETVLVTGDKELLAFAALYGLARLPCYRLTFKGSRSRFLPRRPCRPSDSGRSQERPELPEEEKNSLNRLLEQIWNKRRPGKSRDL